RDHQTNPYQGVARAIRWERPALETLRGARRAARAVQGADDASPRRIFRRRFAVRIQRLSAATQGAVSRLSIQERRGLLRINGNSAREQNRPRASLRQQLPVLRRAARAVLLHRSPDGPAAM